MSRITCTACGERKKKDQYYENRKQCIPCYKERRKTSKTSEVAELEVNPTLDERLKQVEVKIGCMTELEDKLEKLSMVDEKHKSMLAHVAMVENQMVETAEYNKELSQRIRELELENNLRDQLKENSEKMAKFSGRLDKHDEDIVDNKRVIKDVYDVVKQIAVCVSNMRANYTNFRKDIVMNKPIIQTKKDDRVKAV